MQSQRDAERIMELGAQSSRVVVTGNVKFDEYSLSRDPLPSNFVKGKDEFWWVAGSTHPGEEEIVLDIYEKIVKDNPQWRLLIAPRHIERAPQIKELVNRRGLKGVVVIDTIGQLRSLYSLASLVFVGKSLCVGGGHNIIEPAFYGKAIIIGPKVENFRDIVACFKEGHAVVQVEDVPAFERAVLDLCADPSKREILGQAARKVIAANQGATKRSLERLAEFIK
jgi:3-deoxy-D-manno-octulosonic-acid transferase